MIRVYRLGLLPPVSGAGAVRQQMRAHHDLRNDLTAIERGRRAAVREAQRAIAPDLLDLEQAVIVADEECAEADRAIRAQRAATRSRSETEEQRAALKGAKGRRKVARAALAERRRAIREDDAYQDEVARIEALASDLAKSAYDPDCCYWGQRALASAAVDAARKAPLYDGTEPNDPRFARWDGSGSVYMQIQSQAGKPAFTAARLYGSDRRLRIDPVATWKQPGKVHPKRRNYDRDGNEIPNGSARALPLFHMRVQSTTDGDPVWGSWPVVAHREIPADATVKGATVHLARRGPREEWSVSITVDVPDARLLGHGDGAVALNFGWRVVPNGIRVATWVGSDGEEGQLVLDHHAVSGLRKHEDVRHGRDTMFDLARGLLVQWIATQTELPAWFVERTASLGQWKSCGRLASLVRGWAEQRFDGDEDAFAAMSFWRYRDHHLWAWEEGQRTSSLRHRREVYRRFAADLSRRYGTIVVEDFDLRTVARRGATEDKAENETARSNRQLAAVSELRTTLKSSAEGRGGGYVKLAPAPYTHVCHSCGHAEAFDASAQIHHLCSACKTVWDQDLNAAHNVLAAFERRNDEREAGPARNGETASDNDGARESKWSKAKRRKAERVANDGGARKETDSAA